MSVKYGSTSSRRFGLPYAISRIAVCLGGMDVLHQSLQVLDGAVREHAVTEVEDMPGAAPRGLDHPTGAVFDDRPGPQQQGGIQVALDATVVPARVPRPAQVDPPIHPDHVAPGLTHQ